MKNFTEKQIEYIVNSYKNGVSKNKLRLEFNKARQSEITQEITEVLNGSNAVR